MALKLNDNYVKNFISDDELNAMAPAVADAHQKIVDRSGEGADFLGWVDLPVNYDKEEFERIKKAADKIKNDSKALIVIGIGGSYLGDRKSVV